LEAIFVESEMVQKMLLSVFHYMAMTNTYAQRIGSGELVLADSQEKDHRSRTYAHLKDLE
jgi:hypothetical protein